QREHRQQNMRHTTPAAARPPRPHRHRRRITPQHPRPGPPPRPQRPPAIRTLQLIPGKPVLDPGSICPYREHSASARDTALPGRLGQRDTGRAFVCPHRHGAAANEHDHRPRHTPRSVGTQHAWNRTRYQQPQHRLTVRAQALAELRGRRPKAAKLAGSAELRGWVQAKLEMKWSPEEISARLAAEFPGRAEMRVSHETIYQSIYVQGRGALRRELAASLRTGRALRKPRRQEGERRGRISGMVNISERPAEAADRAVPGHWEGDLLAGAHGRSAIGTLVERAT